MPRRNVSRLIVVSIVTTCFLITAFVAIAAQAQEKKVQTLSMRMPAMIGLVADNRLNLYTVSSHTGNVFCIPPESKPILIAKVPGIPTSLSVDRQRNVFVGTEGGTIYLVSREGNVTEAYHCRSCPVGLEMDRDGGLIIAMESGDIIKVDRTNFLKIK